MQTHPDVAGPGSAQNEEKFKRISEAYSILGSSKERRRYDFEISETGVLHLRKKAAERAAAKRAGSGGMGGSFGATLPRNIMVGSILGLTVVTLGRMMIPARDEDEGGSHSRKSGQKKLVEAWKNPSTGRFETPQPWNPLYQKDPTLSLVPRDQVHSTKR